MTQGASGIHQSVRLSARRDGKNLYALEFTKGTIMIGRSRGADLPINDDEASRQHCMIMAGSDGSFSLVDSGSTNGTIVNGSVVQRTELKSGDTIRIGATEIIFELVEAPSAHGFESRTRASEEARRRRRSDTRPGATPSEATSEGGPQRQKSDSELDETSVEVDPTTLQLRVEEEIERNIRDPEFKPTQLDRPEELIQFRTPTVLTLRERASLNSDSAEDVDPRRKVFQVSMSWLGEIIQVAHLRSGRSLHVGSAFRGNDFVIPSDQLPDRFLFIKARRDGAVLYFTDEMTGEIEVGGQIRSLAEMKVGARAFKRKLYTFYQIKIDFMTRVRIFVGSTSLFIQAVPKVKRLPVPFWKNFDTEGMKINGVTTAALFLFLLLLNLIPVSPHDEITELVENRFVELFVLEAPPVQAPSLPSPEVPQEAVARQEQGEGARARGPEGKAGRTGRVAPGIKQQPSRETIDRKMVAQNDILSVLRSKGSVRVAAHAGQIDEHLRNLSGASPVDTQGVSGKSIRGLGSGGGGPEAASENIGGVGVRGTGGGARGTGTGSITTKAGITIASIDDEAEISGELTKEEIRRVVNDHYDQIKYCYERQLNREPGLSGKLAFQWYIGAAVASPAFGWWRQACGVRRSKSVLWNGLRLGSFHLHAEVAAFL